MHQSIFASRRSNVLLLFILILTKYDGQNQCYADNNLRRKQHRQTLEKNVKFPFIARVKTYNTHDAFTISNEFDCMDERMKNMTKEKDVGGNKDDNYINLMIHGNKELEHLTEYSQVSEIKLDKEWTYEIHRKAALASQQSSSSSLTSTGGYDNAFKTMSGSSSSNNYKGISSNFQCFRNLESSLQTLLDIERLYPHLAEVIDIGDSYLNKYDILAIKLTNRYKRPNNDNITKSKMFAMFGLHAREYSPPELGARFIEKLVTNYGVDADITTILDTSEIHIVLQSNPDAREVAEKYPYLYRRKNMNREHGKKCEDYAYGVDLNRNFPFKWSDEGASNDPCHQTYHGPYPASEPEVQAIVNYIDTIFENGTIKGTFFDVHSYGRLDIWPYTYTEGAISPDNKYFANLAEKFNSMNGHTLSGPGQPEFIGVASGASLDYAYGTISLMAHALELGDDFYQDCDVFDNDISPRNIDVLLYGAKITRDPFLLPMGPDVTSISLSNDYVTVSSTICVTVTIKPNKQIQSKATITDIIIKSDNNIIDGITIPVASAMRFNDDDDNDNKNTYNFLISLNGLDIGRHTLHIQGTDSIGYTGPMSSIFFIICDPDMNNDDDDDDNTSSCITIEDTCTST